jgi:hypothetical protein
MRNGLRRYYLFLVIFTGCSAGPVFAQDFGKRTDTIQGPDTAYIADYTQLLTARFFLLYQDASLVLNPGSSDEIIYSPNVSGRIGIAGIYKWFGLGISMGNSVLKRNTEKYGNTSVLDLRVNAYGRSVAAELYLQNLRGFFLKEPVDPQGDYYKIPDMRIFSLGFTGYYIYNHKRFSIRSAFIQNERQKKSAGSFILRPTFLYYKITSDSGIIPSELAFNYAINSHFLIQGGDFYSFGLSPGYAYTLVFLKKFYLNAAAFPGVLWQHYNYEADQHLFSSAAFTFTFSWRAAAGYNTDRFYIGASIASGFDKIPGWAGKSNFYYDIAQMRFWIGTRFNWFKKKK